MDASRRVQRSPSSPALPWDYSIAPASSEELFVEWSADVPPILRRAYWEPCAAVGTVDRLLAGSGQACAPGITMKTSTPSYRIFMGIVLRIWWHCVFKPWPNGTRS